MRRLYVKDVDGASGDVYYYKFAGTSSETKPTRNVATGSEFLEVDTDKKYVYDEDSQTWVEEENPFSELKTEITNKVSDAKINGTSIVDENNIANIPVATSSEEGVARINEIYGIKISSSSHSSAPNTLQINKATSVHIKQGSSTVLPIVPELQHESAFYGLAKAAGNTDQASSSNPVGTYTNDAKAKIQQMFGVDIIHSIDTLNETTATGFTEGYVAANGTVSASNDYHYSSKIAVTPGQNIEFYKDGVKAKVRFLAAYDESESAVSAKGSNAAINEYTVPDGIFAIIISVSNDSAVWKARTTSHKTVINGDNANEQIESATTKNNCLSARAASLADGSRLVCGDNDVSVDKHLAFHGFFSTFVGLIVGHGYTTNNNGSWLEIDSTKAKVYRSDGSSAILTQEYTHGLTFADYIGVIIVAGMSNAAKIIIYTNGGSYTISSVIWYGRNREIFTIANGNAFTDASLVWNAPLSRKNIWAFGDSYFDNVSDKRWPKYLVDLGISSVMWDGYSGRASLRALESFKNDLKIGTPKYVLWALGMNDADSSAINTNWKNCVDELLEICANHEIIPILCTIPNTASINHTYKNAWIKASGYRYIDFAKAVGASSYPSSWYTGMLYQDGTHPDVQGAIALFNQAITDFPELLDDET